MKRRYPIILFVFATVVTANLFRAVGESYPEDDASDDSAPPAASTPTGAEDYNQFPKPVKRELTNVVASRLRLAQSDHALRKLLKDNNEAQQLFNHYVTNVARFMYTNGEFKMAGLNGWGAGIFIATMPRDLVINAIGPELNPGKHLFRYLQNADKDVINHLEFRRNIGSPRPSISRYLDYIRQHSPAKAMGLTQYVLEKFPRRGFVGLVSVVTLSPIAKNRLLVHYHKLELAILQKQKNGDNTSLTAFSHSQRDWVRLYAAQIMKQHPSLRNGKLVRALKDDHSKLVRETVASFTKPDASSKDASAEQQSQN